MAARIGPRRGVKWFQNDVRVMRVSWRLSPRPGRRGPLRAVFEINNASRIAYRVLTRRLIGLCLENAHW